MPIDIVRGLRGDAGPFKPLIKPLGEDAVLRRVHSMSGGYKYM
jgi:hypothetical protein